MCVQMVDGKSFQELTHLARVFGGWLAGSAGTQINYRTVLGRQSLCERFDRAGISKDYLLRLIHRMNGVEKFASPGAARLSGDHDAFGFIEGKVQRLKHVRDCL